MLYGALCLLRDDGAEDAFQLLVHLAHPISGGCEQCVQKHGCRDHILTGPGEGGELPHCMLNCCGPGRLKRQLALVQVGQSGLKGCPLIGELTLLLCGLVLDVVLRGVLSSFLVGH
jgi:hypothetical protein